MIADGRENVFFGSWGNLCSCGAFPLSADFYAVARHHRRLVGAEVGKLGRSHRLWWARPSWVETRPARIGAVPIGGSSNHEQCDNERVYGSSKRSQRHV
jgi:hypothetical protein